MNPRLTHILSPVMAVFSWLALGYLVYTYPPDTTGRALFLALLFLATAFTTAPLLSAVHVRAWQKRAAHPPDQAAPWREAGLLGIYTALCAWLRFIRVLNWVNALLLLAVLVLTEILLLARE